MGGGPGFAQRDGDIGRGERGDGKCNVGFGGTQNGVGHRGEEECDVGDDAEESETTGCGAEVSGLCDGAVDTICVDVFDGPNMVGYGLMTTTRAVTNGTVDATCCDSVCVSIYQLSQVQLQARICIEMKKKGTQTYSTRITSTGNAHFP